MFFSEADIRQVTESVWNLVLHMPAAESPPQPARSTDLVSGSVSLEGTWNGTITLLCDMQLAKEAAGVMFHAAPDSLPPADVYDAVGELTNMIGGNVRALLPEPCHLSLPVVRAPGSGARGPHEKVMFELSFNTGGAPFWVSLSALE